MLQTTNEKTLGTKETCESILVKSFTKSFFENDKNILHDRVTPFVLLVLQNFQNNMFIFFLERSHDPCI
jgi:hypothetical protein